MDSPELQYLKAMHKVNQKFYAYATLELATTQAMIAALTEMVKGYVIIDHKYDPDAFRTEYLAKLKELSTGFQSAAKDFLNSAEFQDDLENN